MGHPVEYHSNKRQLCVKRHKTDEMATKDLNMGWNCKSDENNLCALGCMLNNYWTYVDANNSLYTYEFADKLKLVSSGAVWFLFFSWKTLKQRLSPVTPIFYSAKCVVILALFLILALWKHLRPFLVLIKSYAVFWRFSLEIWEFSLVV